VQSVVGNVKRILGNAQCT